jgi:hypothetical protein
MEFHDDAVIAPDIVEDGMIMRIFQAWRMLRLFMVVQFVDGRRFIERINLRPIKSRKLAAEAAEQAHFATLNNPSPWLTAQLAESKTRKPA